jgi:hypothetical protein
MGIGQILIEIRLAKSRGTRLIPVKQHVNHTGKVKMD